MRDINSPSFFISPPIEHTAIEPSKYTKESITIIIPRAEEIKIMCMRYIAIQKNMLDDEKEGICIYLYGKIFVRAVRYFNKRENYEKLVDDDHVKPIP